MASLISKVVNQLQLVGIKGTIITMDLSNSMALPDDSETASKSMFLTIIVSMIC